MAIYQSNTLTIVDQTDSRKFEVYIKSNLPTVQIFNQNTGAYSPDWSSGLELTSDVYLDSRVMESYDNVSFKWSVDDGSNITEVSQSRIYRVTNNELASKPILTYICVASYQNITATSKITFTRVDAGLNGSNGAPAPAVQAQYSADGATGWSSTINTSIHKYIRYSYDGGKTWTVAIKIVGEDGTSVNIRGTATSKTAVSGTSYYTLVYNSATITGAALGDAYLLDGNLYVCVDSIDGNDYFMDVGRIQGPQGKDGQSSYVFIRYATDANGSNMSVSPSSTTTHIGICTVNTNVAPTSANSYTWSKFVGDSAKNIVLSGDSQVFKVSATTPVVYTPSTIRLTANRINIPTTTALTWSYNHNDNNGWTTVKPDSVAISGDVLTITGASLTTNSLTIKVSDGSVEDIFTVYKAFDGANGTPGSPGAPASVVFLTNENISFSANASGQVTSTSFTTNVVAYSGVTKVTPTVKTNADGIPAITGLPSGMTVAPIATSDNEQILKFSITKDSTLGSASSNNGTITIPVTSPVKTNLILSWSKINTGVAGVGISSTTVTYGVSYSSSAQPTDWKNAVPEVGAGKYLWTRTIIDYTDPAIADTVTYTYAKQGDKGDKGDPGSPVTVSSIQYQEGASATTAPTGTWQDAVVSVAAGKYLWTKTTFSDSKVAYGVAKQGSNGDDAYTVILTNESHVFAGSTTSAIAGEATTQALAYLKTTAQSVTVVSVNGVAATTTATNTGIAGLTFQCSALTSTSPTITFKCSTSFVSPSGSIPIVLSVGGVSITKMFTYSIAFKGATGTPSTSYWLVSNASAVQKTSNGDILCTPATLTFTGRSQSGTGAPANYAGRWILAYSTDGSTYTDSYTSTANEATASITSLSTYKAVRARMYLAGGTTTLLDEQIIPFVSDGETGGVGEPGVTFQVYSNNGYALSTSTPTILLQTFAYIGDIEIKAGATYQWYKYENAGWVAISGATNSYFNVSRDNVSFSNNYMCKMQLTDKGTEYVGVVTIDDKSDENKVFASKPSNYFAGDLWIVGSDYIPSGFTSGTMLRAQHPNATYKDSDWVSATRYDDEIDSLKETVGVYKQYFAADSTNGLRVGDASINNNTLTVDRISTTTINAREMKVESPLTVSGKYSGSTMTQAPIINIGNFSIVVESNGSLSIVSNT